MKKRISLIVVAVLLIIVLSGTSLSWFLSNAGEANSEFQMGRVRVELVEEDFKDIENLEIGTYEKNVQVRNIGTSNSYVRVKLVPEWSEASLPVSNIVFNLSGNGDWTEKQEDGYYYFKYYLEENEITSSILDSITFTEISPEYEGASFTLNIVTEGVQKSNNGWKAIWDLTNLPFTPDQPWTP